MHKAYYTVRKHSNLQLLISELSSTPLHILATQETWAIPHPHILKGKLEGVGELASTVCQRLPHFQTTTKFFNLFTQTF